LASWLATYDPARTAIILVFGDHPAAIIHYASSVFFEPLAAAAAPHLELDRSLCS
jgi:hypothetical protein